jgi:hypothetical protein
MRINAEILADSINPFNQRVTTFVLTYPRFIHSEIMTHRSFSRNSASSRAVPISTTIHQVQSAPASPVCWGMNQPGMQADSSHPNLGECESAWQFAAKAAATQAVHLQSLGLHKQIVNRVLEPFMWMRTIVTATDYDNFFALRVHKDAQPEFQVLAREMLRLYLSFTPKPKEWGEWHMPYGDKIPLTRELKPLPTMVRVQICTGRLARVSYFRDDGVIDVDADERLHDRLLSSTPKHMSPFEHCALAAPGRHANFNGWLQYRRMIPEENVRMSRQDLVNLALNYDREAAKL